jgi:hypothetical protein
MGAFRPVIMGAFRTVIMGACRFVLRPRYRLAGNGPVNVGGHPPPLSIQRERPSTVRYVDALNSTATPARSNCLAASPAGCP